MLGVATRPRLPHPALALPIKVQREWRAPWRAAPSNRDLRAVKARWTDNVYGDVHCIQLERADPPPILIRKEASASQLNVSPDAVPKTFVRGDIPLRDFGGAAKLVF